MSRFNDLKKAANAVRAGAEKANEMRQERSAKKAGEAPAAAAPADWILTVKSHDEGKNADVTLYPDRIERVLERSAMSLSRARQQAEVIPVAAISSVTARKDGMMHTVVSTITSGATIDFRLRHDDAAAFKDAVTKLVLAHHAPAPSASPAPAADMASQLAQLGQLHASGSLSDDEFAAAKAKLLG